MQSTSRVQGDAIMAEAHSSKRKPESDTRAQSNQAARHEPVDWEFVATLVQKCTQSHFEQDGSEEEKAVRAQRKLLPLLQAQARREAFSYFNIDQLVFDILKSPMLIKEVEALLFAHYEKLSRLPLQNVMRLAFAGKIPSYPEGGINAIAAVCERFRGQINIRDDFHIFDTMTRMAILQKWNELREFRLSVRDYFAPLLYQLSVDQKHAEAREVFIQFAILQPAECASFLRDAASLHSKTIETPLDWALLLLETLNARPFHPRFLDALKPLAELVEQAKGDNVPLPDFERCLIPLLGKVRCANLTLLNQKVCLDAIHAFSLNRAHQFSMAYMPFLKELLCAYHVPAQLGFVNEYWRILHAFIDVDEFFALWPLIQKEWLATWIANPQQEQAVAQFFVHVTYRHPHAPLIPEMRELLAFRAKGFQSNTIPEKDLLEFALVAHYLPETLSISAPFSLDRLHKSNASTWRALALLKGRWSETTLALFTHEDGRPFCEYHEHAEDLIEILLRLDLLTQKQLEWRLSLYIRTRRSIRSFAPLFNLIETIAQKFTEGKLTAPLEFLPQLIGRCRPLQPPPPRLLKSLQIFAHLGFLDPALFRPAP